MAAISQAVAHRRARVGALTRAVRAGERPPTDLDDAKQDLAYVRLAEHAARVVSTRPAPTDDQLQRVAAILRAGASPPPQPDRTAVVAQRIAELDDGGDHAA